MAHLGFEDVLPPVEPVVEAAADAETLAESMNDVSITQPAASTTQPEGEADENFFNEGTHFQLNMRFASRYFFDWFLEVFKKALPIEEAKD